MVFMPWTQSLELGIPMIDDQHKVLVDLINALHDASTAANPDRNAVTDVLEGLLDYTHNHFIVEEVMFQKYSYPETNEHQAEHTSFTGKMMDWLTRFEDGEDVNNEVMDFLKDWLIHHICEEDRSYLPFMRAAIAAEKAAEA